MYGRAGVWRCGVEEEEVGVGRCMVEEEVEVDEEGGGREAWCGGKC